MSFFFPVTKLQKKKTTPLLMHQDKPMNINMLFTLCSKCMFNQNFEERKSFIKVDISKM